MYQGSVPEAARAILREATQGWPGEIIVAGSGRANIARDGGPTQVPFAVKDGDGYLVLSGNHRVKATLEALGQDYVGPVQLTDDPLTEQQRVALQLSHNAIAGEDDPGTLKLLYDQLDDIDWKLYSGLDDKTLALLAEIETPPLPEPRLDYQMITLLFLPSERERVEAVWKEARTMVTGDAVYLARLSDYDRFMDALDAAGRSWAVTNAATSLLVVLDIFEQHRTELSAGWADENRKKWVPLVSIFGNDEVPPGVARVLARAVEKMKDAGDIGDKNRFQALEYLAAEYLGGA